MSTNAIEWCLGIILLVLVFAIPMFIVEIRNLNGQLLNMQRRLAARAGIDVHTPLSEREEAYLRGERDTL